jgi:hypothetical protein
VTISPVKSEAVIDASLFHDGICRDFGVAILWLAFL